MAHILMFVYALIIFLSPFLIGRKGGPPGGRSMSFFTTFYNLSYIQYFITSY